MLDRECPPGGPFSYLLRQAFLFRCAYTGDAVWTAKTLQDWIFFQFLLKPVLESRADVRKKKKGKKGRWPRRGIRIEEVPQKVDISEALKAWCVKYQHMVTPKGGSSKDNRSENGDD